MAGNDVQIQLTAKDGASSVFKTVGRSAQDMGKQVDTAGKTSEASLTRVSKAGAVAGAAFASLGGVLSLASHANAEAEASQARLTTAIENSGHSVDEYQDQLDAASKKALQLGFDDEDAADSIAKMTTATGDAQTAISDLAIAEDIARARNIDLASATNIVIAAEQGRIGALKRVGIEVDASMSKEQVMDALRAKFAGNAEAYSTTTAAGFDRLKNSTENALEAIGAHLGPANQLLMVLPGLSAGFTGVGAAVGALAPELTATAAAAAVLDVALGPVGIAAAAIAAGTALVLLASHFHNDFTPAAEEARGALDDATDALIRYQQAGSTLAVLQKESIDDLTYITNASSNYEQQLHDLTDAEASAQASAENAAIVYGEGSSKYNDAKAKADQLQESLINLTTANAGVADSGQLVGDAVGAANAIIADTGPAADDARAKLHGLNDDVESGAITWIDYLHQVVDLNAALPGMNQQLIESGVAAQKTTDAINGGSEAGKEAIQVFTGYKQSIEVLGDQYTTLDGQIQKTNALMASGSTAGDAHSASIKRLGDQYTNLDGSLAGNSVLQAQANEEAAKAKQLADDQTAAFLKQADAIGFLDSELDKLIASGTSTWAERTSSRVQRAGDTLGSLFSVVVDGTDSIAQQSESVNKWALDLINVQGVYGKIDDLYAHGQITLTTYNAAQEAGTRIFADNAAIQEDVLRIQTKQAPLIADATDAYAKYIDQLADLPPQQELVALGWMDSNEAAKANAALALAAAAAQGEYGDAGEAAATAAITAQARADPAFSAMLQDMGLISVGADGTISVNFPDSETIQEAVDGLTASVDALTLTLGGVPPNVHTDVTADISQASNAAAQIRTQLDQLNGYTANTVITVGLAGPGVGYTPGFAHGGMLPQIPHAQHGSSMHGSAWWWVGESGAELTNGRMVLPHTASVETSRGGGGGGPTYHIANLTVVANDPRQFSDQMRSYNFGYGARS